MKKKLLFAVLAVCFIAGSAFAAGDLKFKFGIEPVGNIEVSLDDVKEEESSKIGISLCAEYLYPVHEFIKVGGGAAYYIERGIDADTALAGKLTYIPIYATITANPVEQLSALYFKGNLGYTFFDTSGMPSDEDIENNGGLYWDIGVGYELPVGFFFEVMYGFFYSSMDMRGETADATYSRLGINIGYKLSI
ncbi:MAG: porin family protein [Endomicrobium sp.]|nr:porin family protein [Endomicrobium sp.]